MRCPRARCPTARARISCVPTVCSGLVPWPRPLHEGRRRLSHSPFAPHLHSRPHALASACTHIRSRRCFFWSHMWQRTCFHVQVCPKVPRRSTRGERRGRFQHCACFDSLPGCPFFMKKNALCAENYNREIHVLNGFSTNVLHRTYFERGVDDTLPKTQPWHRAHA